MERFSQKTIENLKYYVYVYSDPDTKKPFYVGKGKGNRVFDHLSCEDSSEKSAKIKSILAMGKKPVIEILVHGVDEETAFKVEAAAIDLIGIENLTNQQRGHNSSTYGKIDVNLLEARYNCEELNEDDIDDDIILIRINRIYNNEMTAYELYDATRGYWRLNKEKAQKAKYALAVYYGMVLEVYKVVKWLPAMSTMMLNRKEDAEQINGRYEFIGTVAEEAVRRKYKDKSVANIFSKGDQNPIRYVFNNKDNQNKDS